MKGYFREIIGVMLFAVFGFFFIFETQEVNANAHSSIQLRDGGASWEAGGYRPSNKDSGAKTHARDVDPEVKRAWERGNIINGGKYPSALYDILRGNYLAYDVYEGSTNHSYKQGWSITRSGGEDFFTFDGWAINVGYYHHDLHNQATYIAVENKKNNDTKIYKARLTSLNAGKDVEYGKTSDSGPINNKCSNTGSSAFQQRSSNCNMEYKWVGFRAYIPLNDLFVSGDEEWELYIVKAVRGHGRNMHLVYEKLVLPYSHNGISWNQGNLNLSSGQNLSNMRMVGYPVIRQHTPRGLATGTQNGYFARGDIYPWVRQDESAGTAVWHGVRSKHDNNATRYTSSVFWQFSGSIATLSWKRTDVDVTILHIDEDTNTVLRTERLKAPYAKTFTHNPFPRGTFKNHNDYPYVAAPASQRFSQVLNGDRTIRFYYRVAIADPSRIVEMGGGQNTHGHAKGQAFWELRKMNSDDDSQLYVESNFVRGGYHWATRNHTHTVKVGDHVEINSNPIALVMSTDNLKDEELEYNFEYEYTNHYTSKYRCAEPQGSDCFRWAHEGYFAEWNAPYGKKFRLSDTEGTYTHYSVSRLGRINNKDVLVYPSMDDVVNGTRAKKASDSLIGYTYYIKEKAVKGNETYFRLSNSPNRTDNLVGWVNELDLITYTHFGMDGKSKQITLNGQGQGFSRAWGGSKQVVRSSLKNGDVLHVNLTETVGNNLHYRGRINGTGENVWVHQTQTRSDEIPVVKESAQQVLKQGTLVNSVKMMVDHRHGEMIQKVSLEEVLEENLVVGRKDAWDRLKESTAYEESWVKDDENDRQASYQLKTQSNLPITTGLLLYQIEVPSGDHIKENYQVLKKGNSSGYYLPVDVDDSLKEQYGNDSGYALNDYAFPLQQNVMDNKGVNDGKRVYAWDYATDLFFMTKHTGFIVGYPYAEKMKASITNNEFIPSNADLLAYGQTLMRVTFEEQTGVPYVDELLYTDLANDFNKNQRYAIPISPSSELKPGETYTNYIVLENMGLSDLTIVFGQDFSFDHYLFGSGHDDAWIIEQVDSRVELDGVDASEIYTITIKHEDKEAILEVVQNQLQQKVHKFRLANRDFIERIKGIVGEF